MPSSQECIMRIHQRLDLIFLFCLFISPIHAQLMMKRICFVQAGAYYGSYILCCDSDHDGLNEIIFETALPTRWEVWEHRPMNRYELVFADTGAYPYPPGITTGNFRPYDVGDIDRDSLTDLVGPNIEQPLNPDTFYNVVATQESPNYSSHPQYLSWWYRYTNNVAISEPFYFLPDLDQDERNEIIFAWDSIYLFENITNNQNCLVYVGSPPAQSFTFGNFDLDGRKEFVTAWMGSLGMVFIYENTGNNQYELVRVDTTHLPNGGLDVFSGDDLDGDGSPEFFVAFYSYPSATNYLYMWEASGNNTYQRTLIDQIGGGDWSSKRSICGDVDGDGIEELAWSIGGRVMIYKATGNNQFQRIWDWINNHGGTRPQALENICDMNNNGYNELVISGYGKTSFFEIEAVRLLRPNGGETFCADSNEVIQWQTFYPPSADEVSPSARRSPPRCDSLSLFYSTNNGRTYSIIVTRIPGTDTSYVWTVPNVNSDSCKIKIIAYGPGWQYDESDGVFRIISTGIEEIATLPLAMTLGVKVYPNPAKSLSVIRFSLPVEGKVSLQLYNISGRLVKTLVDEYKKPGNYTITLNSSTHNSLTLSAGVYFLTLETQEKRIIERLVVIR